MVIGTTAENQICSPFHLFRPCLLCVSILVPSIVLSSFLGLEFSVIIFTTGILILSTSFIVKFSKRTKVVSIEESDTAQGAADDGTVNECKADGSLDLTSESEISSDGSGSGGNGELKWMVSGNVEPNPEISDEYSTSDGDEEEEECLIEIDIPSNEEPKQNMQSSFPTFLPESIFQRQDLVELLAEINEEENLIEIDISMGSIKCPAFEIEA
ncbi:uncharacterized protein LOC120198604 [Hibiscus syriacus]|uniref:uncharacterized protein LOC120198604 n=1 Tax=Hibiscus syriacus TaxID=106335 RepID=UPI0019206B06|nr:uncharacterized protein LOC120198604 [Hibiscus syriacus]